MPPTDDEKRGKRGRTATDRLLESEERFARQLRPLAPITGSLWATCDQLLRPQRPLSLP